MTDERERMDDAEFFGLRVEALFDSAVGDDNDREVGEARKAMRASMDADWLAKVLR